MKAKELAEATRGMKLLDIEAVEEQGRKAFRFGMTEGNNPFQADTPHALWARGWNHAKAEWDAMMKRWKGL